MSGEAQPPDTPAGSPEEPAPTDPAAGGYGEGSAGVPQRPQFCPWCGTPIPYDEHEHEPRYESLASEARARGEDPPPLPERVRELLAGDSFAGACPGCRTVSHVIGHRAPGA